MIVQKVAGVPNRIVLDLTDDEMRELKIQARRDKCSPVEQLHLLFVMELALGKIRRERKPILAAKKISKITLGTLFATAEERAAARKKQMALNRKAERRREDRRRAKRCRTESLDGLDPSGFA